MPHHLHIILKFMPLSNLRVLLTLITIMVLLRLTMKSGTGFITMTRPERSVTSRLTLIPMETSLDGTSLTHLAHAAKLLMDGHMLESILTMKAI